MRIAKYQIIRLQKPELRSNCLIMFDSFIMDVKYDISKDNEKFIIFINDFYHNKEDYDNYYNYFKKQSYNVLSFDWRYSHNVKYKKGMSLGNYLEDLITIINLILENYPNQKIYLLGHGLGANLIINLNKKVNIKGIILLNPISRTNFIDFDWKTRFLSYYGIIFNRNIKLPVILDSQIISNNKDYQQKMKAYFEDKPLLLWYKLQMISIIRKSNWKIKQKSSNKLCLQIKNPIFSNRRKIDTLKKHIKLQIINDSHDLLWSQHFMEYSQLIDEWIQKNDKEKK